MAEIRNLLWPSDSQERFKTDNGNVNFVLDRDHLKNLLVLNFFVVFFQPVYK